MAGRPLILAIETATPSGSVAVTRGGWINSEVVSEILHPPRKTHSRWLLGGIKALLEQARVTLNELDGVAISLGPGSFTGLRIGLAAAKAVAMAASIKLVGVPTLDVVAHTAMPTSKLICAMLDARKQELYSAIYKDNGSGNLERLTDYMLVGPEELTARLDESAVLVGSGISAMPDAFSETHETAQRSQDGPRASIVGLLAGDMLSRGEILDPMTAAPLYVRKSEAEINLSKK